MFGFRPRVLPTTTLRLAYSSLPCWSSSGVQDSFSIPLTAPCASWSYIVTDHFLVCLPQASTPDLPSVMSSPGPGPDQVSVCHWLTPTRLRTEFGPGSVPGTGNAVVGNTRLVLTSQSIRAGGKVGTGWSCFSGKTAVRKACGILGTARRGGVERWGSPCRGIGRPGEAVLAYCGGWDRQRSSAL